MFGKKSIFLLCTGIIFQMITSCSGYDKVLKSHDYRLKYRKAMEYYEEEHYSRASTLFDQIFKVYMGTSKADTLTYYLAMAYYHQKDYTLAAHYFEGISENFPGSNYAEESDFLAPYCYYKMSPKPSLDQKNTYKAMDGFQIFAIKYTNSSRLEEVRELLEEMQNKLVRKAYLSARLYFDLGEYKASIIALENCLDTYPDSKYREELMFLILKSSFLLADNSVRNKRIERFQNTVDEYYAFVDEFPESDFIPEAKKIYLVSSDILEH